MTQSKMMKMKFLWRSAEIIKVKCVVTRRSFGLGISSDIVLDLASNIPEKQNF